MKLRQLKYVLAIADNGLNMSTAAERVYTSQPGVSKQVKLLEQELGVELFVRKGRSLAGVTAAGAEVIRRARVIVREVESIRGVCAEHVDTPGAARNRRSQASGRPGLNAGSLPASQRHTAIRRSRRSEPTDASRAGYARIADFRTGCHTRARLPGRAEDS
jgi:DNA-binding transcriptional LysR family regulator